MATEIPKQIPGEVIKQIEDMKQYILELQKIFEFYDAKVNLIDNRDEILKGRCFVYY